MCKPFDYSGAVIKSIPDYEDLIQCNCIQCIKSLINGHAGGWVQKTGDQSGLYELDPIKDLKQCGTISISQLALFHVYKVKDVKELMDELASEIVSTTSITNSKMQLFWNQAMEAKGGERPGVTNYHKYNNPWEARYGVNW